MGYRPQPLGSRERHANLGNESLLLYTMKALGQQLLWAEKMCQVRGELGVAKNPVEQEEHHSLGPR